LGDEPADVHLIAEDFVKVKTFAAFAFAVPAFIGLALIMADHKSTLNVVLFVLPLLLMVIGFPSQAGMQMFAGQVNDMRGLQPPDGETEPADGQASSANDRTELEGCETEATDGQAGEPGRDHEAWADSTQDESGAADHDEAKRQD
jgi:hypothetical protein